MPSLGGVSGCRIRSASGQLLSTIHLQAEHNAEAVRREVRERRLVIRAAV